MGERGGEGARKEEREVKREGGKWEEGREMRRSRSESKQRGGRR